MPKKDLTVEPPSTTTDLIGVWASQGYTDRAICSELRLRGIQTAAGKQWTPSRVALVIARQFPHIDPDHLEVIGVPRDKWFTPVPRKPRTFIFAATTSKAGVFDEVARVICEGLSRGHSAEAIAIRLNDTLPLSNYGQTWQAKSVTRFARKNGLLSVVDRPDCGLGAAV